MKRSAPIPLLGLAWLVVTSAATPPRTPATLPVVNGEVLVAWRGDSPLGLGSGGHLEPRDARVAAVLERHGLASGELVGVPPAGSPWRFLRLRSLRPDFDPRRAAAELGTTGAFFAVCPNVRLRPFETLPNDPYLGLQWYAGSSATKAIDLPLAWDSQKGSAAVPIAILDTGVDTGHPDLAGKIWHNPGEIPGNGVDDDHNGYIDDDRGWDFGNNDNNPDPEPMFDPATAIDVGFHGTFCAGIAGAATNNAEGIAGAGWNCRIMALKAANSSGDLTAAAIAAGIEYAAAQGAKVLSMSFGGPGDPGVPEFFQSLMDMATSAGVMCVAAAGNDGNNLPVYPAACDSVTAVAATDSSGARASFSNWGSYVDIAAPGADMWSTICRNYTFDDWSATFYEFLWGWDGVNPYMYGDGTSFACPLVAGVCGLIRSFQPALTPRQVAIQLAATGDVVAYDHPIGRRVNAYKAVTPAQLAVEGDGARFGLALEQGSPNPFGDRTTLRFTLPADGRARLAIYDCGGRLVNELLDRPLAAGRHALAWDGAGRAGRVAGGVYIARLESAGRSLTRKLVWLGR